MGSPLQAAKPKMHSIQEAEDEVDLATVSEAFFNADEGKGKAAASASEHLSDPVTPGTAEPGTSPAAKGFYWQGEGWIPGKGGQQMPEQILRRMDLEPPICSWCQLLIEGVLFILVSVAD